LSPTRTTIRFFRFDRPSSVIPVRPTYEYFYQTERLKRKILGRNHSVNLAECSASSPYAVETCEY
jgi:hypothetical protein